MLAVALALVAALAGGGAAVAVLAVLAGLVGAATWIASDKATRSRLMDMFGISHEPEHPHAAYGFGGIDLMGGAGGDAVEVAVSGPNDERVEWALLPCVIGRGAEVQVSIADELASREHAVLERHGDEVLVRDLGSRNGLLMDGQRVTEPSRVLAGTSLRVGSTTIEIRQISVRSGKAAT